MRYRKRAMIVAAQPEATEAGAEILTAGGNAVDAAMACAFVQGVVDPLMCGIAGFGSCGIAMPAAGFHGYIDFHAPAPRSRRARTCGRTCIESEARDGYGFILRGRVNDIGYQSICAPGQPAGVPRRAPRARPAAVGADPGARDRVGGGRLDGAAARGLLVGGGRPDGPRGRTPSGSRSRRPRAHSTAGPTARPSGWATAWSTATSARRCG